MSGFDLVPDFVVLGAPGHVLPKIDALHVGVGIVEMEEFFLITGHELGGGGIGGRVVGNVGDFFLSFGLNHVFEKLLG